VTTDVGESAHEAAILDFLHRWYRYGGGSEDHIFAEFGIPAKDFFLRAAELLRDGEPDRYPRSAAVAMRRACRARLWLGC
jgi:hypothetical protein